MRRWIAALALAVVPWGGFDGGTMSFPTLAAQDGLAGLQPVAPIRKAPQPMVRPEGQGSKSKLALRWRTSGQVSSPDAVAQPGEPVAAAEVNRPAPSLRPTMTQPRLAAIGSGTPPDAMAQRSGGRAAVARTAFTQSGGVASDPFLDPFGDGNALTQTPAAQDSPLALPPFEAAPQGDAAQGDAFALPEPLAPAETASGQPSELPVPTPAPTTPAPSPFRSLSPIEPAPAQPVAPEPSLQGPAQPNFQDAATEETESPSDRLGGAMSDSQATVSSASSRLNCADIETRLAERTIRQVSLDISPPFRPDLRESDVNLRTKQDLIEQQPYRTWTSRTGEELARGRFTDIAFEKIIIESEVGEVLELATFEISNDDLDYVTQVWGLPSECQMPNVAFKQRQWLPIEMTWRASELLHKPLYFEEVNLERYGHTAGPFAQPIVSSAHFFFNIAVLPYKMGIHPPNECQYALGYYRPGNCAPWIIPPVPLSLRGALWQAGAVGAGIGIIP